MLGLVFGKGLIRSVSVTASASSENAAGAFDPAGHNESFALNQQGVSDAVACAILICTSFRELARMLDLDARAVMAAGLAVAPAEILHWLSVYFRRSPSVDGKVAPDLHPLGWSAACQELLAAAVRHSSSLRRIA